jgi:tetratricopeptide (TPR) repeat protein
MSHSLAVAERPPSSQTDPQKAAALYAAEIQFSQGTALLNRRRFADAEACLREANRFRPDHAETLNNLGTAVWNQGRSIEAEEFYRLAHALEPDNFAVVNNLGNALWDQRRLEDAAALYLRALELKPDTPQTLMNLGVIRTNQGQYDEANAFLRESLRIQPNSHQVYDNLGSVQARLGDWEKAIELYNQSLALRPDYPEAHRNRAFARLALGDYEQGWKDYEWRLECRRHQGFQCLNRPRWDGSSLDGRAIFLHTEQGIGDTLQFIRYARRLKESGAARVIVYCPDSLTRLLALCPDVDLVIATGSNEPMPDFDVHASVMSLPALTRTTVANFPRDVPYLFADADSIDRWRAIVDRAVGDRWHDPGRYYRIGVAWQGNPLNGVDRSRSFPLQKLAPLARLPFVKLVSLQKGDGVDQLGQLEARFDVAELHVSDGRGEPIDSRDFLDTASAMHSVDLVITPETAVAHLAGAIGVPVWAALAHVSDWRWQLEKDTSPWYPSMRLFRQPRPGEWDAVFAAMATAVRPF